VSAVARTRITVVAGELIGPTALLTFLRECGNAASLGFLLAFSLTCVFVCRLLVWMQGCSALGSSNDGVVHCSLRSGASLQELATPCCHAHQPVTQASSCPGCLCTSLQELATPCCHAHQPVTQASSCPGCLCTCLLLCRLRPLHPACRVCH